MRSLLMVCAVVGLALLPSVASAAEVGQVPDATLAQMGLSGMQQMTDVQGLDIRGSGFAAAGGYSKAVWTRWGYASTANAYVAVSHTRNAEAGGTTSSQAGFQVSVDKSLNVTIGSLTLSGNFTVTKTLGVSAIGSSSAYAK